jgi:alkaline phosphatase
MIHFTNRLIRPLSGLIAVLFCTLTLVFVPGIWQEVLAAGRGNGVNVILMIGDGMGWEMARSAAIAKGTPLYTSGKGSGLSFQTLSGYALATTYGTTVAGTNGAFSTNNSALTGSNPITGQSPVRPGFSFKPLPFNPGINAGGGATDPSLGNLVGYDPSRGGPNAWTPISPTVAQQSGYDKEYIKLSYPDSANTATTLYTGVKSYNNAMGVDLFEKKLTTIQERAALLGKSTGVVTSVPITHATPGASISAVNRRNKYDNNFPDLDNILQQSLRLFKPTVLLGGGHPLDFENRTNAGPIFNYTYIRESTYNELKSNPTNNRYGYRFLERGPNAAQTLLNTARQLDPNQGERLLGLYGARGQNGNLPTRSANGDFSTTGLDNFSVSFTAIPNGQVPQPDTIRPLAAGETDAQFIAKERNENPTLADLTKAALEVLGKDPDGFWLMVEGGDIDWAAHDNNMDNLIGTMLSFDAAVQTVIDWIGTHGGWRRNVLIVSADHDHYLTLNPNFPDLLKQKGADTLTFVENKPDAAGHFWGSDPTIKYGWTNHSNRPVPVYFQGNTFNLGRYVGRGYKVYGFDVPGIPGLVDQAHIYEAMLTALTAPIRNR